MCEAMNVASFVSNDHPRPREPDVSRPRNQRQGAELAYAAADALG